MRYIYALYAQLCMHIILHFSFAIRKRYTLIWFICADFILINNFTFGQNIVECCLCFFSLNFSSIDACLRKIQIGFLLAWCFGFWHLKKSVLNFAYAIVAKKKIQFAPTTNLNPRYSRTDEKKRAHFQWHRDSKSIDKVDQVPL